MIIKQTYLRRLPHVVGEVESKRIVTPVLKHPERFQSQLSKAGFTSQLAVGEKVLPDPKLGPRARFNSKGRHVVHRDQPKEQAERLHHWTYKQRHGDQEIEVEESKMITYLRYPRTFVPPPSLFLSVARSASGEKIVVAPGYSSIQEKSLINSINLILEIGCECELIDDQGEPIIRSPEISLDWEVLPKGRMPWTKLREHLEPSLPGTGTKRRGRVLKRVEFLESLAPDFHARGHAGYAGYLVFGFSKIGLFVCESTELNNATYIFGNKWEEFTQLTKAEVIEGAYAVARLVHLDDWEKQVASTLS